MLDNNLEVLAVLVYLAILLLLAAIVPARLIQKSQDATGLRPFYASEAIGLFILILFSVFFSFQDFGGQWINLSVRTFWVSVVFLSGVWVAHRRKSSSGYLHIEPFILKDEDLDHYAEKVLTSEKFHTALQSILPRSNETDDGAIDQLPFVLTNIQQRRKSFEQSSQLFFLATILFGLISTVLIVVFGFIILDQASIGTPKHIADIRENLSNLTDSNVLYDDLLSNNRRINTSGADLSKLEAAGIDPLVLRPCYINLDTAVYNLEQLVSPFLDNCGDAINRLESAISEAGLGDESAVVNLLKEKRAALKMLENQYQELKKNNNDMVARIKDVIKNAEVETNKEWALVYELLKRVSIGVIIVGFLLAILRYLTKQYSEHLLHLGWANEDDIAVRRFYVSLSNSVSEEERSAAIQQFIRGSSYDRQENLLLRDAKSFSLSEQDKKLMGDLLEILKKKV